MLIGDVIWVGYTYQVGLGDQSGNLYLEKKIKTAFYTVFRELLSCESQLMWHTDEEQDCGKNRYILLRNFWHLKSPFQDTNACKYAHAHVHM